jgi:hypothetical protein
MMQEIFKDEKGRYSSNRFVGIIAGCSLCICLIVSAVSKRIITPDKTLVESVMFICCSSLGLGTISKVAEKIYNNEGRSNASKNQDSTSEVKD